MKVADVMVLITICEHHIINLNDELDSLAEQIEFYRSHLDDDTGEKYYSDACEQAEARREVITREREFTYHSISTLKETEVAL